MSDSTSKQVIPRYIEPRRFAQSGASLTGILPAAALDRLREATLAVNSVRADVKFSLGDQRKKLLTGQVFASTQRECQRCLEPVDIEVVCDVALAVVWSEEEAKKLPDGYEPWIATEEEADLYGILEEEILLNMPYVAFHEYACVDRDLFSQGPDGEPLEKNTKKNPFQVLEQLKGPTKK